MCCTTDQDQVWRHEFCCGWFAALEQSIPAPLRDTNNIYSFRKQLFCYHRLSTCFYELCRQLSAPDAFLVAIAPMAISTSDFSGGSSRAIIVLLFATGLFLNTSSFTPSCYVSTWVCCVVTFIAFCAVKMWFKLHCQR